MASAASSPAPAVAGAPAPAVAGAPAVVGTNTGTAVAGRMDTGAVRKAMALRVKYRVKTDQGQN